MYQEELIIQEVNGTPCEIRMIRKNVKRMTLRIDRQGNPCLSVPLRATRADIWKFMMSCSDWLAKNAGKREFFTLPDRLHDGDEVFLLGEPRKLMIRSAARTSLTFVSGAAVLYLRDAGDPERAASAYEKALKELALSVFHERLSRYADVIPERFGTPRIRIRKMTSRWGSANQSTNEIHLSLFLIKAPLDCIDSVVLHEAVHFTHMDHGTEFYGMLLDRMPDYKQRSAKLKEYARK